MNLASRCKREVEVMADIVYVAVTAAFFYLTMAVRQAV